MEINGKTKITGLFGCPVKHTLSPAMHNAAFQRLDLGFIYVPFEVSPKNLKNAVNSLKALEIAGVNVTIPHKENVIPLLDKLGPLVKQIGSVNTIVNSAGKLIGYNTDAPGFLKDLRSQGFSPKGKTVILFGAGGAGKAVAAALALAGATKIYITDMAAQKARALSKKTKYGVFLPFRRWKDKISESSLLVNATPVGMLPGKPVVIAKELSKGIFVYDLVYNRRTELREECQKAGVKYSNGLGMLLYQGALAFEYFTEKKAPVEVMRKVLNKQLQQDKSK
jgi:shikimate dehydrogenase